MGGQWFYVVGILKSAVLASAIDTSVLVGYPAAEKYLGFDGHPATVYLRAQNDRVKTVDNLLAATANPESPSDVNVSQPSDALVAQADAKSALNGLFLGLGAVALLVGAVGVANIMIISVLERRAAPVIRPIMPGAVVGSSTVPPVRLWPLLTVSRLVPSWLISLSRPAWVDRGAREVKPGLL